jgi:hypothetical protein
MISRKQTTIVLASLATATAFVAAVAILARRRKGDTGLGEDDLGGTKSLREMFDDFDSLWGAAMRDQGDSPDYRYGGTFGGDRWRHATQDEPSLDELSPNAEHFRSFGPEYQPTVTDDALDDAAALEDTAEGERLFDDYLESLSKKEAKAARKTRKTQSLAIEYRGALAEIAAPPCSDMEPDDRPCGVCAECIASDALSAASDPGVEDVTRYKNALSYIAEDDCVVSLPDMPACGRCAPCLAKKALAAVEKKGS